jgi:hypothetical protein
MVYDLGKDDSSLDLSEADTLRKQTSRRRAVRGGAEIRVEAVDSPLRDRRAVPTNASQKHSTAGW